MRRAIAFTVITATGLTWAAPAAAADPTNPVRQSGQHESLYSWGVTCSTDTEGVQTCSELTLSATEDTSGAESVFVSVNTYQWAGGDFVPVSFESGQAATDGSRLTVRRDLEATVLTTQVDLQTCDGVTCQTSRTVTVSAQDSVNGTVTSERETGMSYDGICTYRYVRDSKSAPVAGTITLDGITYDETGYAGRGTDRVTTLCK